MQNTLMDQITLDDLKRIEGIQHVPDDQLQWLLDVGQRQDFEPGDRLFEIGDVIDRTFIIIDGKFRICIMQSGKMREMVAFGPLHISGFLPFSRGKKVYGYGECTHSIRGLTVPAPVMMEATRVHYELTEALVHLMTTRVREYTAFQQQNEKMVALGKLSAGLAHELNNPAAAIARDAATLKKQVKHFPELLKEIASMEIEMDEVEPVNQFIDVILKRPGNGTMNMMVRADKEDELTQWLEDNEIDDYEMAETLVDFGFTIPDLDKLKEMVTGECIAPVLSWVNNNLITEKIVTDIQESSRRISELVTSVKNFTHMDRSTDMQVLDIHKGIRNTITMLNYKLRKGNIELVEDFNVELPEINGLPGELNQVWTNLIDNAIDAMEVNGNGILTISTRKDGDFIQIMIIDNGPGIPEDIRSQIFDPFFTTKEMGKGTGMGLDVVSRIVRQHNGSIKVKSAPGHTEFEVCLPMLKE
jgi:signal transduction histidine kinase